MQKKKKKPKKIENAGKTAVVGKSNLAPHVAVKVQAVVKAGDNTYLHNFASSSATGNAFGGKTKAIVASYSSVSNGISLIGKPVGKNYITEYIQCGTSATDVSDFSGVAVTIPSGPAALNLIMNIDYSSTGCTKNFTTSYNLPVITTYPNIMYIPFNKFISTMDLKNIVSVTLVGIPTGSGIVLGSIVFYRNSLTANPPVNPIITSAGTVVNNANTCTPAMVHYFTDDLASLKFNEFNDLVADDKTMTSFAIDAVGKTGLALNAKSGSYFYENLPSSQKDVSKFYGIAIQITNAPAGSTFKLALRTAAIGNNNSPATGSNFFTTVKMASNTTVLVPFSLFPEAYLKNVMSLGFSDFPINTVVTIASIGFYCGSSVTIPQIPVTVSRLVNQTATGVCTSAFVHDFNSQYASAQSNMLGSTASHDGTLASFEIVNKALKITSKSGGYFYENIPCSKIDQTSMTGIAIVIKSAPASFGIEISIRTTADGTCGKGIQTVTYGYQGFAGDVYPKTIYVPLSYFADQGANLKGVNSIGFEGISPVDAEFELGSISFYCKNLAGVTTLPTTSNTVAVGCSTTTVHDFAKVGAILNTNDFGDYTGTDGTMTSYALVGGKLAFTTKNTGSYLYENIPCAKKDLSSFAAISIEVLSAPADFSFSLNLRSASTNVCTTGVARIGTFSQSYVLSATKNQTFPRTYYVPTSFFGSTANLQNIMSFGIQAFAPPGSSAEIGAYRFTC